MTTTITAKDTRVQRPASVTTTDNDKIKQIVVNAYRLAGYRVTVTTDEPADQVEPELDVGEGTGA